MNDAAKQVMTPVRAAILRSISAGQAETLDVTHPVTARHIDDMIHLGWMIERPSPGNALFALTPEGLRQLYHWEDS